MQAPQFPIGEIGTSRDLGGYYQDFTPIVARIENHELGPLTDQGLVLTETVGGDWELDTIRVSQQGLASHQLSLAGDDHALEITRNVADWLVQSQTPDGMYGGCWLQSTHNRKYPRLRAPWTSALAQGQAVSMLLRAGQLFGAPEYTDAARRGVTGLMLPVEQGGVLWRQDDRLWLEEYPLDPPLHVLNGGIYALFGAFDARRVGLDDEIGEIWDQGWRTVANELDLFDTGFWSRYDATTPELASDLYHRSIHVPLLQIMAELTGDRRFSDRAVAWEQYPSSRWSRFRVKLEGRYRWTRTRRLIS